MSVIGFDYTCVCGGGGGGEPDPNQMEELCKHHCPTHLLVVEGCLVIV